MVPPLSYLAANGGGEADAASRSAANRISAAAAAHTSGGCVRLEAAAEATRAARPKYKRRVHRRRRGRYPHPRPGHAQPAAGRQPNRVRDVKRDGHALEGGQRPLPHTHQPTHLPPPASSPRAPAAPDARAGAAGARRRPVPLRVPVAASVAVVTDAAADDDAAAGVPCRHRRHRHPLPLPPSA